MRISKGLRWALAAVMLACVHALLLTHHMGIKLFVMIWLPAVLGAAQAWHGHKQLEQRARAAGELGKMPLFAKRRMVAASNQERAQSSNEVLAVMRLLCRCLAQHAQRELGLAAAEETHVPV